MFGFSPSPLGAPLTKILDPRLETDLLGTPFSWKERVGIPVGTLYAKMLVSPKTKFNNDIRISGLGIGIPGQFCIISMFRAM